MGKIDRVREELEHVYPDEFDEFVGELWEKRGHEVSSSSDRNVHFETKSGGGFFGGKKKKTAFIAIYCAEDEEVTKSDLNRILELRWNDDFDEIVVVTNRDFSSQARKQGNREKFTLVDGHDLAEIIVDERATNLLYKYTEGGSVMKNLFFLCVVLPLKLTWFVIATSIKLGWFVFVTVPVRLIRGPKK